MSPSSASKRLDSRRQTLEESDAVLDITRKVTEGAGVREQRRSFDALLTLQRRMHPLVGAVLLRRIADRASRSIIYKASTNAAIP